MEIFPRAADSARTGISGMQGRVHRPTNGFATVAPVDLINRRLAIKNASAGVCRLVLVLEHAIHKGMVVVADHPKVQRDQGLPLPTKKNF